MTETPTNPDPQHNRPEEPEAVSPGSEPATATARERPGGRAKKSQRATRSETTQPTTEPPERDEMERDEMDPMATSAAATGAGDEGMSPAGGRGEREEGEERGEREERETAPPSHVSLPIAWVRIPVPRLPTPHIPRPHVPTHEAARAVETVRGSLPPADRLAFYAGLGALAVFGLMEWPVASAIGVGTWVALRGRRGDGQGDQRARTTATYQP